MIPNHIKERYIGNCVVQFYDLLALNHLGRRSWQEPRGPPPWAAQDPTLLPFVDM